jgi:hypothetical protein
VAAVCIVDAFDDTLPVTDSLIVVTDVLRKAPRIVAVCGTNPNLLLGNLFNDTNTVTSVYRSI